MEMNSGSNYQGAVFIDRDGTLTVEAGYINHPDCLKLYEFSLRAVRKLNRAGIRVIVVTNQAGAARGYFPEKNLQLNNLRLQQMLAAGGARLDGLYYCPHLPGSKIPRFDQKCSCRKPEIGLLLEADTDLSIDLTSSYVIGDKYSDVKTAHNSGGKGILVLTGYGPGEYLQKSTDWERPPDFITENISTAVDFILADLGLLTASFDYGI